MERKQYSAEDILQAVKNVSQTATDDCLYSGALMLAEEILSVKAEAVDNLANGEPLTTKDALYWYVKNDYMNYDQELSSLHFDVNVCMRKRDILEVYRQLQKDINGDEVVRLVNGVEREDFIPKGEYKDVFEGNCKDFLESFNGREYETGFCRYNGEEQLDFIW